jgi:hypothetical protein
MEPPDLWRATLTALAEDIASRRHEVAPGEIFSSMRGGSDAACSPRGSRRRRRRRAPRSRRRLARGGDEAVGDDSGGDGDEDRRRPGVARGAEVGRLVAALGCHAPQHEDAGSGQAEEQPVAEDDIGEQLVVGLREQQDERHRRLQTQGKARRAEAWVELRRATQKQAVLGHGVIEPRAGHGDDSEKAEAGDDGERSDEARPDLAGERPRDVGGEGGRSGDLGRRQDPQVDPVEPDVDDDDQRDAEDVGLRQGLSRVADLGRQTAAVLPAAVSEEHRHERGEEGGERDGRGGRQVIGRRRRRLLDQHQDSDRRDAAEFENHQAVVGALAGPHSAHVDLGQDDDHRRGERQFAAVAEPHEGAVDVAGERGSHCGNAAGVDDEEQREAVEEAGERPPGARQVDVLAADDRQPRAELGVDEAADHRQRPAGEPDEQHPLGRRQDARDVRRIDEDTDADDRAGDDDRRVPQPELAAEAAGRRRRRRDHSTTSRISATRSSTWARNSASEPLLSMTL